MTQADRIVAKVARQFDCFGAGSTPTPGNPIAAFMRDKPPTFAMGVDVRAVVECVLMTARSERRARPARKTRTSR